jgi:hypothetical protein
MDCLELEKAHPNYHGAVKAEQEQVKDENYNYPGLPVGNIYFN